MPRKLKTENRVLRGAVLLVGRYFDHHVGRDGAALTYYMLFALFPMLIFLSNLIGMLTLDVSAAAWLENLPRFVPQEVTNLIRQYLIYVGNNSSGTLLSFSLVFTIYFPFRAVHALFDSVRKAYDLGPPARFLRYQCRALLFTLFYIVLIPALLLLSAVSGHMLELLSGFVPVSERLISLWNLLRFLILGVILFFAITLLYFLALDGHRARGGIWPGGLAVMVSGVALSALFSLYVANLANYTVIYGSIGAIIVLLLWLYLIATVLILGAEFNCVLLHLNHHESEGVSL